MGFSLWTYFGNMLSDPCHEFYSALCRAFPGGDTAALEETVPESVSEYGCRAGWISALRSAVSGILLV